MTTFRNSRGQAFRSGGRGPTHGFALVVSLMLMSFMVLLLVSLSGLSQVDLQQSDLQQSQLLARANARLAMLSALAQLQEAAGPDTRVTATGDAVGAEGYIGYWTGVWRSDGGGQRQWLVSGDGDFGSAEPSGVNTAVEFLSFLPESQRVSVPRISLADNGGGYAWWTADEGVKARINVLDPYRDMAAPKEGETIIGPDKTMRERYRLLVAQESGNTLLLGAENESRVPDMADASARRGIEQLSALEQISLLEFAPEEGEASLFNRDNLFHEVTLHSRSVLADARNGGLKQDLTGLFESGAAAPTGFPATWWSRLIDYYNSAGAASLQAKVDTTGNTQSIFPVLVKTNLLVSFLRGHSEDVNPALPGGQQGHKLYLGMSVGLSLHNPYSVEMKLPDGFVVEVILPSESNPANDSNNSLLHFRMAAGKDRSGNVRDDDEIADELLKNGLSRFYVRLKMDGPVIFEAGQTLLFTLDSGGDPHVDISGSANGALVAKLRNEVSDDWDFVYHEIPIDEGDVYTGLYGAVSSADPVMLQAANIILELDSAADLYVQVLVGLPAAGSGEPQWFSGFRSLLDISGSAPEELRIDSGGAHYSSIDIGRPDRSLKPGGGLGFTFEMPMARRQSLHGYAVRPLADFNMRAVPPAWNASPGASIEVDNYYHRVYSRNASSYYPLLGLHWIHHGMKNQQIGHLPESVGLPVYMQTGAKRIGWAGPSPFATDVAGSTRSKQRDADVGTVYFDVPSEKPLSLGALRHASVFDSRYTPAYSVGASWAPAFPANTDLTQEDDLYKLNRLLWDSYFFSGYSSAFRSSLGEVPDYEALPALPSSRLGYQFDRTLPASERQSLLGNPRTVASQLMVEGGFNVNSTSVTAWRALLASMRNALRDYRGSTNANGTPFARYDRTLLDKTKAAEVYKAGDLSQFSTDEINGKSNSRRDYIYNGIRVLSDAEIDALATNIVAEIRRNTVAYGQPFLSMGEFVNRSLQTWEDEPAAQLKGVLQLAIDQGPRKGDTETSVLARLSGGSGENATASAANYEVVLNDRLKNNNFGIDSTGLVGKARSNSYPSGLLELEPRSADAPAFLSQADILAALGPVLSVRSDTFLIRAYGDTVDASGNIIAKAWCEALVQRLPEPVVCKGSNQLAADYYEPAENAAGALGRRFVVLGFRWLTAEES